MPKKFDPESSDYDMESAVAAGLKPDETGHWPSRDPKTGLLLKGRAHPTWNLTVDGERKAGYEIYEKDGRYYSRPKGMDYEAAFDEAVKKSNAKKKTMNVSRET